MRFRRYLDDDLATLRGRHFHRGWDEALWRLFRQNKPADPFARFTETYGMRSAAAGSGAAPFGNGYRRAENASGRSYSPTFEEEPHSLGILRRDDSLATALKTLGVVEAAGAEEISAAYRKLAQTHHPDKVAKLKPEVREYSEQRMKEINAAYALLRHQRDGSASSRGWLR